MRTISQKIPQPLITKISLKITSKTFLLNLLGANELTYIFHGICMDRLQWQMLTLLFKNHKKYLMYDFPLWISNPIYFNHWNLSHFGPHAAPACDLKRGTTATSVWLCNRCNAPCMSDREISALSQENPSRSLAHTCIWSAPKVPYTNLCLISQNTCLKTF